MIVIDYNQTAISNLMAEMGGRKDIDINLPLIRHMILNSIRGYKQKFGAKYGDLVIACDNRKYWRRDYFPHYKANRKKDRDASGYDWKAIFEALSTVREELDKIFPYPVINVEGAEADDVIAVLAEWTQTNDLSVGMFEEPKPFLVVSGDHDFIQLQKYSNVSQYSPIHKKMIKPERKPEDYVLEHIIRGDSGDGVPNVLSDDTCLVEGRRQKPVSTKKLEEWVKDRSKLPNDAEFTTRYERNKLLVDLSMIPTSVKYDVINTYVSQPKKDRSQLMNYFMQNKMKQMLEVMGEF
jgi:hypothetical protein